MAYLDYLGNPMPVSATPTSTEAGTDAGAETITAAAGPTLVDSGGGTNDLLIGGPGDDVFIVRDGSDRVQVAGGLAGVKSITAFMAYSLPANVQNLDVSGSYNFAVGNGLNNLIVAHSDHAQIFGGPGNDVLVGSGNGTSYIEPVGDGNDVIYGFTSTDTVRLIGSSYRSFADVAANLHQRGSDVVLQLDPSEQLTFRDVSLSIFDTRNFLLPLDRSKLGPQTFDDEFDSLQLYDKATHQGQWIADFGSDPSQAADYQLTLNGEQQVYVTPGFTGTGTKPLGYSPFSIANGVLTITASPIPQAEQAAAFGAHYFSGLIDTRYLFEQKYGYFEIRMALPDAKGAWPAFWMVPDPNPAGVEADVGENIAIDPQVDKVRAYGDDQPQGFIEAFKPGDHTGFHTYGMLWTPQTVTWYYDETAVYSINTPSSWNQPMYMLVNLAVGAYGGPPDPSQFPAAMNIDYVRAYALPDGSTQIEHAIPPSYAAPSGSSLTAPAGGGEPLYGGVGNDTLTAVSGPNTLVGGDGNDSITGGTGFDQVNGNKGDDTVIGHTQTGDWLLGGQGGDLIDASRSSGHSILNGNFGSDTVLAGSGGDTLRGGQGDDRLTGGPGNDWLSGDLGHDTLTGGAGADTFHGAAGFNSIITDFNYADGDRVRLDPGTQFSTSQTSADVTVTLSGGGSLVLHQTALAALPADWIAVT